MKKTLPIGFEGQYCHGKGFDNCPHYENSACPGSCECATKRANINNTERHLDARV